MALGEDVLILSNRMVEGGVEIIAMSEQAHEQALTASPQAAGAEPEAVAVPPDWQAFNRRMLDEMRTLLRETVAPSIGDPRRDALAWMRHRLLQAGFSALLTEELVQDIPEEVLAPGESAESVRDAWLVRQLAARLERLEREDALFDQGGVFALVGPTGAGKTTTTAKLASRYVMRHGPRETALVTTDSYRIGAAEQLRIYARLLGVEIHALDEQGDLGGLLGRLVQPRRSLMGRSDGKRMMVVDTVGMSQRDQRLMGEISRLGSAPVTVRRLLVLDAARHGDTLEQVIEAWQQASTEAGEPLWGCILTKLDEAARLGPVLDVVIRHRLKLCYLSRGQRVPEDLETVNTEALLAEALVQGGESPFLPDFSAQRLPPAQGRQQALSRGILRQGDALEATLASLRSHLLGTTLLEQVWAQAGQAEDTQRRGEGDPGKTFARLMADMTQKNLLVGSQAEHALWWSKSTAVSGIEQAMPLVTLDWQGMPQPLVWPRYRLPAGSEAQFEWAESLGAQWHLLGQLPDLATLARLDARRQGWLSSVTGSRRVRHAGEWLPLSEALKLGEEQAAQDVLHRGRRASLRVWRLETTLSRRCDDPDGLPVIAWQGVWHDADDGRRLGCRYWLSNAQPGFDTASRLASALALEALPGLARQANQLLAARRPALEDRAQRWQLAAALAALALRLAQEEAPWAMDVRARISGIAQRRCGRRPKALLEGLLDVFSAHETLSRTGVVKPQPSVPAA